MARGTCERCGTPVARETIESCEVCEADLGPCCKEYEKQPDEREILVCLHGAHAREVA